MTKGINNPQSILTERVSRPRTQVQNHSSSSCCERRSTRSAFLPPTGSPAALQRSLSCATDSDGEGREVFAFGCIIFVFNAESTRFVSFDEGDLGALNCVTDGGDQAELEHSCIGIERAWFVAERCSSRRQRN